MRNSIRLDRNISNGLLTGYFLVASPNMDDSYFKRSVILVCANDNLGSFGVVINNKHSTLICSADKLKKDFTVFQGGPVDRELLLAVTVPKDSSDNFEQDPKFVIYGNAELLIRDSLKGDVTDRFLLFKGYCSWVRGQLENEIAEGSWQLIKPSLDILFSKDHKSIWNDAIKSMNLDETKRVVPYSGNS